MTDTGGSVMLDKIEIAAVQMEPKIKEKSANLEGIIDRIRVAARSGAELVVFPECALTGYVFASREEVTPYAETIPGPSTRKLEDCCRELGVHVVAGLIEQADNKCFNAAVLIGPKGLIGRYRKIHLPFLGVDRFLDPGDEPFKVYKTVIGNIGMFICYDCNFPESARVMTLMGVDILALPTNWPEGREKIPKYVVPTRAFENRVHLVAVNRIGRERGTGFIGHSKIIDARGDTVTEAGKEDEIIYGEVSLAESREKHIIFKPGEFEVDCINDRRPVFYKMISKT
jgi:predicted amidohydrolase